MGTRAPLVRCVQGVVVGKYQHASLPHRHPLSVLETLFFSPEERRKGPLLWRDDRWEEMLMVTLFVPLLAVNLTSAFDSILTATDASDTRLVVSEARVIIIFPPLLKTAL